MSENEICRHVQENGSWLVILWPLLWDAIMGETKYKSLARFVGEVAAKLFIKTIALILRRSKTENKDESGRNPSSERSG